MTAFEKLLNIFNQPGFLESNKDLSTLEEILAIVHKTNPEISAEELDEFLCKVSEEAHKCENKELTDEDLDIVSGGGITLGALLVIGGAIYVGYKAGIAIGEAIYYWKN